MLTPSPYSPTSLAIDSLATARLTRLLTTDTLTAPLRERIFNRYPPATNKLSYILTCDFCASVYAAAAITATHSPSRPLRALRPLVYILAIAAPTAILAERKSTSGWS